jgi:hypothetical protein
MVSLPTKPWREWYWRDRVKRFAPTPFARKRFREQVIVFFDMELAYRLFSGDLMAEGNWSPGGSKTPRSLLP